MKKLVYLAATAIISVSLLAGCDAATKGFGSIVKENGNTAIEKPQKEEYRVIDIYDDSIGQEIRDEIDGLKLEEGMKVFEKEGLLFIGLGERNTGGYGIEILGIEKSDDKQIVKIKEIQPDKGGFVTMALTYPLVLIQMDTSTPIVVMTEKGETINQYPKNEE